MVGGSKEAELEARCRELVQIGERQRREVAEAVGEVKARFAWMGAIASAAKASGPVFMGAAGLAGVVFGARSGGLLKWVSRIRTGLKMFRLVRQYLGEKR